MAQYHWHLVEALENDIDEENRCNKIFIADQIPVVYVEYEEELIVDELETSGFNLKPGFE